MPNRILRDGILTSERVNSLAWQEEVFYRRLMSVVDDFGRYHANPKLLRAALYPLLIDRVSDADVEKWLTSCVTAALVSVYPAQDGKRYLEVLNFRQQARAKESKYPAPTQPMQSTCVADAMHTHSNSTASAPVFVFGDVDVDGKKPRVARATAAPPPDDVPAEVWADWLTLRKAKRAPVTATVIDSARAEAVKAAMTFEAFLRVWCQRGSQGLAADWLKPHERANGSPQPLTVPSRAADATAEYFASQRLTPDQRAASEIARGKAMQAIKGVA